MENITDTVTELRRGRDELRNRPAVSMKTWNYYIHDIANHDDQMSHKAGDYQALIDAQCDTLAEAINKSYGLVEFEWLNNCLRVGKYHVEYFLYDHNTDEVVEKIERMLLVDEDN